jgi:hypothetical protein
VKEQIYEHQTAILAPIGIKRFHHSWDGVIADTKLDFSGLPGAVLRGKKSYAA